MLTATREPTIGERVIDSLAATPDPRLKEIMTSLLTHLHAFVQEVNLAEAEWLSGIRFLIETGQMPRPEFIILSDVLGISSQVVAGSHAVEPGTTESTVLGPFYRAGAPELPASASISQDGKGETVIVRGQVLSTAGQPIANALLDVWQGNDEGLYEGQDPNQPEMNLRGKFRTDTDGCYEFRAVKPAPYQVPMDGPAGRLLTALGRSPYRPAHIHLQVSAPGFAPLTTHLFVKGDPYLATDAVFAVKNDLVADFVRHEQPAAGIPTPFYTVAYDFVLKSL
jgi:hydroxyquinol 1,2-dioxygenase